MLSTGPCIIILFPEIVGVAERQYSVIYYSMIVASLLMQQCIKGMQAPL